jgi:hypothetical protein
MEQRGAPFDPLAYGPILAGLLREPRLNALGPGAPNEAARPALEALTLERAFAPQTVGDPEMASACLAGLWLRHDFLDESHRMSQEIETTTGSYWHGLMHRREPDYANAKYWFRRVGDHAVFPAVRAAAANLAAQTIADPPAQFLKTQSTWDPFAFIDLCEQVARGPSTAAALCREIQAREWEILFDYCYRQAVAGR